MTHHTYICRKVHILVSLRHKKTFLEELVNKIYRCYVLETNYIITIYVIDKSLL